MTIRPILIFPDRRLQQAAPPVAGVGPEVLALMDDLAETMYAAPGVGLAAPQIGVAARVLVMDCAGEERSRPCSGWPTRPSSRFRKPG